jgi:hypothetical protein
MHELARTQLLWLHLNRVYASIDVAPQDGATRNADPRIAGGS